MKPFLVMACGGKKVETHGGAVKAINLYDGPQYKMLRRYGFHLQNGGLDIWILSAKHGLMGANALIGTYNQLMDEDRAAELTADTDHMCSLTHAAEGRIVYVFGGVLYRQVVTHWSEQCELECRQVATTGSRIGEQLQQLKKFLGDVLAERVPTQ